VIPKGTKRRLWHPDEDAAIREHYGQLSATEIGQMIGRTRQAVYHRATKTLGITKWDGLRAVTATRLDALQDQEQEFPLAPPPRPIQEFPATMNPKTRIIRSTMHDYFASVTSAEQAYTIGMLAADGNVGKVHPRIILGAHVKDRAMVEFIRDRLNPAARVFHARPNYVKFQISSRQMAADLARYGVLPAKSRILQWPRNLGPLIRPYLLGYFDGDGAVFLTRGRKPSSEYPGWTVCSGSQQFIIDLKAYIEDTTGVVMEKVQHREGADLWQVATTGTGAFVLDEWLHQDGLGMARKRFPEHVLARYR
jgi:hypothetical protein